MTMKKGKPKVLTEIKVNMAEMIGSIEAQKEVNLGNGYILQTQWNILPVEAEKQLEEAGDLSIMAYALNLIELL